MIEPGRKFVQGVKKYRYSINGQEKETELNENITTAEYWEYDSRLGRRWNIDPKPKVWESPYMCFGANPISNTDPNGDDWIGRKHKDGSVTTHWDKKYNKDSKLGKGEFYIGSSALITGTDDKLYELRSNGKAYLWGAPTVSNSTKGSNGSGFSIPAGASFLPASFNFTKGDVKQYEADRENFSKGDFSNLTPEQIKRYTRWAQADKDYRAMSIGVVGAFAAPFVVTGAAIATPIVYGAVSNAGTTAIAYTVFHTQRFVGAITAGSGVSVLLGRNMDHLKEFAKANNMITISSNFPKILTVLGNTRAMGVYNSLWVRYQSAAGSSFSISSNAFGGQYSSSYFMKLEFQLMNALQQSYNIIDTGTK
jgi:hypothetical protein